ncbi:MAG: alkaline phosphatase family protein [Solirubrobacterales bacterium]
MLQFDAASISRLERMLAEGSLPNLAAILERGRRVELTTPASEFPAGAFYSLYSGIDVADHGLIYPFQFSPAEQRVRFASAFAAPPAIWERLDEGPERMLVVDPYESRPPAGDQLGGLLISGWGFRERVVLPRWSQPAGAARGLERRYGRTPGATEVFGKRHHKELLRLREALLTAPGRSAALARESLAGASPDFAWITFSSAHLGGHAFWGGSSVDREGVPAEVGETLDRTLDELYSEVDAAIGAVVEALPDDADLIVTSPMGMDANHSRTDLLPAMLEAVVSGRPAVEEGAPGGIWGLRSRVPRPLRRAVAEGIPDGIALELTAWLDTRGRDWSQTRAFAPPGDNQGHVRLNVRGRERLGIVEPGAEAEELIQHIREALQSFRLEDGGPAIESAVRTDERYEGRSLDQLPDLTVRWSATPSVGPERLRSDRYGTVSRHGAGSGRSGNHTHGDAWAVLAPGAAGFNEPSRPARLEDIAVTVLELLGREHDDLVGEPLLAR